MSPTASIALKDVQLFQSLSSRELLGLKDILIEKSFNKGEMIFLAGESCDQILIVKAGRVKVSHMSASGREQVLEVLDGGNTCACNPTSGTWHCPATIRALTDCDVWFLPRRHYDHLLKSNHKVMEGLSRIFADRLCRFCSLIEDISVTEPDKRLIKLILEMRKTESTLAEDGRHYVISITHEEISQRLALVRETVTRHLNKLKRLNLIDLKPQQIIILKESHLRQIAEA